jgi:drug/metabolite transporter (DMT)-like permease
VTSPRPSPPQLWPVIGILASGLLWGLWWIPLRGLTAAGLTGDWGAAVITAVGAVLLLATALLRRQRDALERNALVLGAISGISVAAWNHALAAGDVVRVTLLFYLSPVWGVIFGRLIRAERLGARRLAGVAAGLAGAQVILAREVVLPLPHSGAEWFALFAGLSFAFMATLARAGMAASVAAKSFHTFLFGAAASAALALAFAAPLPSAGSLAGALPALTLAACWFIPPMILLMWAARHIDAARLATLLLIELAVAVISGAWLTGAAFGWREIAGTALIAAGGLADAAPQPHRRATVPAQD